MRDLLSWHIYLGRWAGVHVRLHAFFVFFVLGTLALCATTRQQSVILYGVTASIVLLISVALHEFGHCYAVRRFGGEPDQVVLWPLGGLVTAGGAYEPQYELMIAAAGPVVSGLICLMVMPILLATGQADVAALLHPFAPPWLGEPLTWEIIVGQTAWINFLLVCFNLLPAYPLDGARMLRAMLRPHYGYRTSVMKVVRAAKFTAICLFILAWFVHAESRPLAWVPLSMLGAYVFFSAKEEAERLHHRDSDDEVFGYDFSQGYTSFERAFDAPVKTSEPSWRTKPGPLRRWFEQRREARRRRQQELEQEEDRRLDDILARLNKTGIERLSPEERALLKRASARYRNRLRS